MYRSISNIHFSLRGSLRRSNKLNPKSNSNPSCNFLSRVGSSRSYPRETKAFRFAVGRDKPWNLSQVPVDTSVRRSLKFPRPLSWKTTFETTTTRTTTTAGYVEKGKEKGDFLVEMHGGKERGLVSLHSQKLPHEHNENRYRCRDIIN